MPGVFSPEEALTIHRAVHAHQKEVELPNGDKLPIKMYDSEVPELFQLISSSSQNNGCYFVRSRGWMFMEQNKEKASVWHFDKSFIHSGARSGHSAHGGERKSHGSSALGNGEE